VAPAGHGPLPPSSSRPSGPCCSGWAPTWRTSSQSSSARASCSTRGTAPPPRRHRLPARGTGGAPRRGGHARLHRRRVPVHRRRAHPHRPVGRRGRPPHRVQRGRPALHRRPRRGPDLPGPGAAATDEVRERAEQLWPAEPWGREQWERLAEGLTFDGMESWLPWLTPTSAAVRRAARRAQVLLVEPARMRDRAADLLAEEADLAGALAVTWGAATADDRSPPAPPFDRLLVGLPDASVWTVPTRPKAPTRPSWRPPLGPVGRRRRGLATAPSASWQTATAWSSPPTAAARPCAPPALLREQGSTCRRGGGRRCARPDEAGRHVVVAPLHGACTVQP
jgi:hypothetical protein